MKKIIIVFMLLNFGSCGDDDEVIIQKSPEVNEITQEPIATGSELVITGKDLDDNPVVIFNGETISPVSVTSTAITINIPDNAFSGKLEIEFEQEAYNTEAFIKVLDTSWDVFEASNYFQVEFVSNEVGFAMRRESNKQLIHKTINGGSTWSSILEVPAPSSLFEAVSANVVYIRTTSNVIKKTVDGGATWQDVEVLDLSYIIEKLFFKNELVGFLLADKLGKSYIFKTIDGGNTWNETLQIETPTHKIEVVYQNVDTIILLDRENNEFIETEDAGINWSISNCNIATRGSMTYDFINQNTAWLYIEPLIDNPGGLFKTSNQGKTWVNIEIPELAERIVKVTFFDELKGHILTDQGGSLYTNNGGETWELFYLETDDVTAVTVFGNSMYVINSGELFKKVIL